MTFEEFVKQKGEVPSLWQKNAAHIVLTIMLNIERNKELPCGKTWFCERLLEYVNTYGNSLDVNIHQTDQTGFYGIEQEEPYKNFLVTWG